MGPLEEAIVERASGGQVSRTKSLVAAVVAGLTAATLTYRVLRSGSPPEETGEG
jgi:hypothetical protein